MREEGCRICAAAAVKPLVHSDDLVICTTCSVVYRRSLPTSDGLREFYSTHFFQGSVKEYGYIDYLGQADALRQDAKPKLAVIERLVSPGKLLDVGCAAGFFLEAASQKWQAVGNELSEYARRNAIDRSFRIYPGDFLKQEFDEAPFDVVTMWEVLEHLSDPLQACRKSASLLRPGGLLALTTVDVTSLPARAMGSRWREFVPPHLYYFSLRSLRRLLARASFRVRSWRRHMKWVALEQAWLVAGMALRRYGVPVPLHWPFGRTARRRGIPVPVCDGLFVLAERSR